MDGENALKKTGLTGTGMALISLGAAVLSSDPKAIHGYAMIGVGMALVLVKYKVLGG